MAHESIELDGTPDPEFQGKPCAYCGKPSEGYFSIERDGFGEGPEVPLCVEHGAYETPTCEEIWERISMAGKEQVKADQAVVRIGGEEITVSDVVISTGKRTPTRQQLAKSWGCDACGVQRYQRVDAPMTAKLIGGPHPGIWTIQEARLCEVCVNQRRVTQVVEAVVIAVKDRGLPVKGTLLRDQMPVYEGLDQWLREHDKGTVVTAKGTPKLSAPAKEEIREKLARGRALFGAPTPEEE